jgi:hypothetical protein
VVAPAGAGQEAADRDHDLVRALLAFGSLTDDNRRCVERIGVRAIPQRDGSVRSGIALRSGGTPIADVLNAAEGMPLPAQLAEDFPAVTQEDWDAVLRLATLVFVAAEAPAGPVGTS